MSENIETKSRSLWLFVFLAAVIIAAFSLLKYRSGEIGYRNADATWHAMLTIQSYDETPISDHKFLPIVSLGQPDDKFIPWGATIPDENGNYYYTSFSWIGYFLPWAFFKIFGLPITERSLYLFNTILYVLAAVAWLAFIGVFYRENKNKNLYLFLATLASIFMPELMHGMGIVYWHQSVLQVTLPIQLTAYYLWKKRDSVHAKRLFFALTLLNPWIEWSGYMANIGYAAVEFFAHRKEKARETRRNILWIVGLSAAAFVLFTIHYLLVIPADQYFATVLRRFSARSAGGGNFVKSILRLDLFTGYIQSFLGWWILVATLFIWTLVEKGKVELRHKWELLLLVFILSENFLMQEHAISYSYDRMKAVFFLSFITIELLDQLLEDSEKSHRIRAIVCILALCASGLNVANYLGTKDYVWKTDYRGTNQSFAQYINQNYGDSTLGTNIYVRGYINLLFHRGIYERSELPQIMDIAKKKKKRYAVNLQFDGDWAWMIHHLKVDSYTLDWGMAKLVQADIYDLQTLTAQTLALDEQGKIVSKERPFEMPSQK